MSTGSRNCARRPSELWGSTASSSSFSSWWWWTQAYPRSAASRTSSTSRRPSCPTRRSRRRSNTSAPSSPRPSKTAGRPAWTTCATTSKWASRASRSPSRDRIESSGSWFRWKICTRTMDEWFIFVFGIIPLFFGLYKFLFLLDLFLHSFGLLTRLDNVSEYSIFFLAYYDFRFVYRPKPFLQRATFETSPVSCNRMFCL